MKVENLPAIFREENPLLELIVYELVAVLEHPVGPLKPLSEQDRASNTDLAEYCHYDDDDFLSGKNRHKYFHSPKFDSFYCICDEYGNDIYVFYNSDFNSNKILFVKEDTRKKWKEKASTTNHRTPHFERSRSVIVITK